MNDQTPSGTVGILDQFQTDLVDVSRRLPNKGIFLVLSAVWLALFQFLGNSTFGWHTESSSLLVAVYSRFAEAGPDQEQQGLWIPFLVLGLFWWKRNELLSRPLKVWWPGLVLIALAAGLHVIGYLIQQQKASAFAFFLGLYGLMGVSWGWQWLRASFFPFFLFIFCVPLGTMADSITVPLQILVCRIVEFTAHNVLGIGVLRAGTQLFDSMGSYQYEVAAACSGIRSLMAIGTMATVGAFLFYRTWWRRILLMGLAIPLAVIGNSIRLLLIIVSASIWGRPAGDYVHEGGPLGIISLLPYVPAVIGLMAAATYLAEKKNSEATQA